MAAKQKTSPKATKTPYAVSWLRRALASERRDLRRSRASLRYVATVYSDPASRARASRRYKAHITVAERHIADLLAALKRLGAV